MNSSKKIKDEEEKGDKTINVSINKGKNKKLETIHETSNFLIYFKEVLTKHQTTKKIEPVKKVEKNENNKTPKNETLTRSNTKAVLNREQKEKDSKHNNISHTIIKDLNNKSAIKTDKDNKLNTESDSIGESKIVK